MRLIAVGRGVASRDVHLALVLLGLAESPSPGAPIELKLTSDGDAFDRAWTIYGDHEAAEQLLRDAYLALPATSALMQGAHGKPPIPVSGALHLLARHRLADPDDQTTLRGFLQVLNDLGIVAYSRKHQTVRIVAPLPDPGSDDSEPEPEVRIVEPDRPYSNTRHLREILRGCREYIWWADPHFERRGFEPLADEADAAKIKSIRILSGTRPKATDIKDYELFKTEMATLGISVEMRVVPPPVRDWHDRFIVTRGGAWNVPGLAVILKGSYSEFAKTSSPPFEAWWQGGKRVEDL